MKNLLGAWRIISPWNAASRLYSALVGIISHDSATRREETNVRALNIPVSKGAPYIMFHKRISVVNWDHLLVLYHLDMLVRRHSVDREKFQVSN